MSKNTKFIFVCGGVLSGVGKGIATASLGFLLKSRGYSVTAVKIDPYLNIDAGLMRPAEHGETFVTEDGGEIDQDLGNYERFLNIEFCKSNNITSGKVYERVIQNEREMKYGGRDVEIFPDLINEIKVMIKENVENEDFVLVEVGGTTGDVENLPFLHAAREMGRESNAAYIMVTYLPFLKTTGELKTKPTQHAVARLREVGILPDFIITRNEIPIDEPRRETISKRCFVDKNRIIDNPDLDSIYDVPLLFRDQKFDSEVLEYFDLFSRRSELNKYKKFAKALSSSKKVVKIALVGKYVKHGASELKDTYISVLEAIKHAARNLNIKPEIEMISSEDFEKNKSNLKKLKKFDGVVVPQGWGSRGASGKIDTIEYVRKNKIPYLGLCYGMQMASIEFAKNALKLNDANSEEIDPDTDNKIIHIMPDQKEYLSKNQYGGTIRLGGWDCEIQKGSLVYKAYKKSSRVKKKKKNGNIIISERHRHRYEFNNEYKDQFEENGMKISGTSPDGKLVEFIELDEEIHPFFVATQGHPEYKTSISDPSPIFTAFVEACLG